MSTTIDKLYLLSVPELQKLFLEAIEKIVDRAIISEMEEAIKNNDVEALYSASGLSSAVLNPILDRLENIYQQAGDYQVSTWPKIINTPFGKRYPIFNIRNATAEREIQENSSKFITNIDEDIKSSIRNTLADGQIRGLNPRTTALNIVGRLDTQSKKRVGGVIGLSSNQTNWSISARQYLEGLDEKYLQLGLRDKRFDKTVQEAMKTGKKLSTDTIDKLINAYNQQALRWRANNISVTETLSAINRGTWSSLQQGINEGYFEADQIKKWWDDSGDSRTRLDHLALGVKYNKNKTIPLSEPFISDKGFSLMYPTDTSLGAPLNQIIHCRCKLGYYINFIKGVE